MQTTWDGNGVNIDLSIRSLNEYDLNAHIQSYHVFLKKWNHTFRDLLKARLERESEYDKFAAAFEKCGDVVRHLFKEKTGPFTKIISFYLQGAMAIFVTLKLLE